MKLSRVIKRITIANDVLDLWLVKINNKVAKPSTEVKENDILILALGERLLTIKVLKIINSTQKKDASSMFEIISDEAREIDF